MILAGYHVSQAALAPKRLSGPALSGTGETPYRAQQLRRRKKARTDDQLMRGGLKEGFVKTSP